MTTRLRVRPIAVWDQTAFRLTILLEPPHVLLEKPWYGFWPTLNLLKSTQILSLQFYGIVDLMILMILSELTVKICTFQVYGPDIPLFDQRSGSLHDSGIQTFEISNLTFLCTSTSQS
jgi:hypothetical protein